MLDTENVLKRKLRTGGVARSPLPDTELLGQAFARQIEKGLRPLIKTIVSAGVLEANVVKVGKAMESVSVPSMLGLIEIDNAKIQGLLNIDTNFAYHLIDLMLGGDPADAPTPITRPFTEIDLALCSIAQEILLTAFSDAFTSFFGRPLGNQLQLAGQRQDVTQVRFATENADVLVYNMALDMGPAARSGGMQLVLPLAILDRICAMLRKDVATAPKEEPWDLWKASMRHAAYRSPVVLNAVLHRRKMTISELSALRVGEVVEIPRSAVDQVQLVVAQQDGKRTTVAAGRLGSYESAKVVKLDSFVDPRLREHLRQLWPRTVPAPEVAEDGPVSEASAPE